MLQYPFAVGDVVTRVLEAGAGDRHVVLLHGVGARADRWRRNIEPLADAGLHLHALDFPGHGLATKLNLADCTAQALADFVTGYLDSRDIGRAALVGTSLGARAAAGVALDRRERCDGLVLVGPIGLVPLGGERAERLGGRAGLTDRESLERKLRVVFFDDSIVDEAMVEEEFRTNNSPGARDALAAFGEYIATKSDSDTVGLQLAVLQDIVPMLEIWGANDVGVPATLIPDVQRVLPRVPVEVIDDAAHQPYFEQAERFNEIVIQFLANARSPNGQHGEPAWTRDA